MADEPGPTLADQLTRLYESIAGFHVTHLLEVGRELGVWQHLTDHPGVSSTALAESLGLNGFYTEVLCKTALSSGILEGSSESGWSMAPHMDVLLGSPGATFDFSRAARTHIMLGADYEHYADAFRHGSDLTYQSHGREFMEEVAGGLRGLRALPAIFMESVLPQLPGMAERFDRAGHILDVGCGGGWAVVRFAESYRKARVTGVEIEPVSAGLAQDLVRARGLEDRCEIVLGDASAFSSEGRVDLATMFLVYHEIAPDLKLDVLRSVREVLDPDGRLVVYDEVYPVSDEALLSMPTRFSAMAQWYELIWGNVIDPRDVVVATAGEAGFALESELPFSRYHIMVFAPA